MTKSTNISQQLKYLGDIKGAAAYLNTYDYATDYASGPINMSESTALFIKIVKKIISKSNDLTLSYSDDHTKIIVTDKTNSDVTNLDLTGLMTKVNFTHLTLEESSSLAFTNAESATYAVNFTEIMSQCPDAVPPTEQDLRTLIPHDDENTASLHNLTYGELVALRYYTKHGDKHMNTMMRHGTIYGGDGDQTLEYNLNTIVSAAIASSALNRLPDIEIPYVIRYDNTFGLLEKRTLAKQDGVSEMHGFSSASLTPNSYHAPHLLEDPDRRVTLIIRNVRGKAIWPISAIPSEYEYVIPPSTQIRYTGYEDSSVKPGIFISAEGANVLMETAECLVDKIMQVKTSQERTVIFKDYYKIDRRVEKKLLHVVVRNPHLYELIVDLDIDGLDGSLIAQLKLASNANADKFVALAVAGLRGCYDDTSGKFPTFDQLRNLDTKDIASLTSVNALTCYERDILTFSDTRHWPSEKVDAITSPIASAFLQDQK